MCCCPAPDGPGWVKQASKSVAKLSEPDGSLRTDLQMPLHERLRRAIHMGNSPVCALFSLMVHETQEGGGVNIKR